MFKDYYEVLGVDPFSSVETIQKAFKQKAHICHPDKGGSSEDFKLLMEARERLLSPNRVEYDGLWILENSEPDYYCLHNGRKVPVVVVFPEKTGFGTADSPLVFGSYKEVFILGTKFIFPARQEVAAR